MKVVWFSPLLVGLLAGCGDSAVTTYQVPKEARDAPIPAAAPAQADRMSEGVVSETPAEAPEWEAPEAWTELPASGVRKAAWQIEGDGKSAEVAVTVFPGDVGGTLANINRWRRQVGLGPISSVDEANVDHRHVQRLHIDTVMIEGSGGQSILASIVPYNGKTWFFKMMGDTELVSAQRETWDEFIGSIYF